MATKQKRKPARRSAARKKKPVSTGIPVKIFSWILMFAFLAFSLGVLGYVVFFQTVEAAEIKEYSPEQAVIFEEPDPPEHHGAAGGDVQGDGAPQVAIIIDDMGYHKKEGNDLLAIPYALTFSFLPHAPHTKEVMETAYQSGRTVLLHLPMQPKSDRWDAGEGALMAGADEQQLLQLLGDNLQLVYYATGVNNHMGSLFTEQVEPMRTVLSYLKQEGLFWIDSFTTAKSVGYSLARQMGVKSARRHVFLDNQHKTEKICQQLEKLVSYAEETGRGIGIGHPFPQTVEALQRCLPKYDRRVVVVGVDELVN